MTKKFSRQVLVSTFPCAHEADHSSTACFHERDAWLCFALSQGTYGHVHCLELRHSVRCLVHHHSPAQRNSCSTCHAEWAPISEWYMCRVVQHPHGVCRRSRSSKSSWSFSLLQKYHAILLDLHRRLLADRRLKLFLSQAPRHHHQRRLHRPRLSTRSLQSSPSPCEVESQQQV